MEEFIIFIFIFFWIIIIIGWIIYIGREKLALNCMWLLLFGFSNIGRSFEEFANFGNPVLDWCLLFDILKEKSIGSGGGVNNQMVTKDGLLMSPHQCQKMN